MTAIRRPSRRVVVVGAGWAGLAAAVQATERGHQVTLCEMARHAGGRARSSVQRGRWMDNGQHIMVGAYVQTLALMRRIGAEPDTLLMRLPLALRYPDGSGFALPAGTPLLAFARGVLATSHWTWRDRIAFLRVAAGWAARRFQCPDGTTVQSLCDGLPKRVYADLVDPLCVAALNTPAERASAQVFLRVLQDALFAGRGGADLLLPRAPLAELLPRPALAWLADRGATLRLGHRALCIDAVGDGWHVDGAACDAVILACSAREAARLAAPVAPAWSELTAALRYEPIVTAYLQDESLRLPAPMTALTCGPSAPAQFAFDLGALGREAGLFAFVVSGARPWLDLGLEATGQAVLAQAREAFGGAFRAADREVLRHVVAEQRATFACVPGLRRPPARIAPGLLAAGDYVQGPYPATIEGAVRSGIEAAQAL